MLPEARGANVLANFLTCSCRVLLYNLRDKLSSVFLLPEYAVKHFIYLFIDTFILCGTSACTYTIAMSEHCVQRLMKAKGLRCKSNLRSMFRSQSQVRLLLAQRGVGHVASANTEL